MFGYKNKYKQNMVLTIISYCKHEHKKVMRTAARISKPCLHSSHSYADAHVTAVLSRALASLCSYLYLLLYKTVVCFQNIKTMFRTKSHTCWIIAYLPYRIYSINRLGRLLNFWTLRVGAYLRWVLIRGWALIKFSLFSASLVCLFCDKS